MHLIYLLLSTIYMKNENVRNKNITTHINICVIKHEKIMLFLRQRIILRRHLQLVWGSFHSYITFCITNFL